MDHWVAECLPCKWADLFDVQDDAIAAAEKHVYAHHSNVSGNDRARLGMGHVQNRTDNAIAVPVVEPEPQPEVVAAPAPASDLLPLTDSDAPPPQQE